MKKLIVLIGALAGLLCGPAQAQVRSNLEVSVGVGASTTSLEFGKAAFDLAQQGALAGVGFGIDTKIDRVIVGVLGRYSLMDIHGDVGPASFKAQALWEAAFRLGIPVNDKVMVYGLLGWSWLDQDVTTFGGSHPNGLLAGGGVEFALWSPGWAGRLEYTWHDLSRETLFGPVTTQTDLHVVRAALVYRFNEDLFEAPGRKR